jgi:hypothetical protein
MDQALIDRIVKLTMDRLLEKMIASAGKQHVLMLFSGAGSGYMAGMQAIQWLSKGEHPLTVVMTASARRVIGEENVRKAGAVRLVGENEWVNTPALVREVDVVLAPTLSMNTAAHLALGLMDSLITTLTLGSLLAGKPVIAVSDGANPFGSGGLVFGERKDTAPALRARMAGHLTALMEYGIQLVKEEDFLFHLVSHLHGAGSSAPFAPQAAHRNGAEPKNQSAQPKVGTSKSVYTTRPGEILTAGDLLMFPPGSTIRLVPGAKLTPLAQEEAHRKELNLVYE